MQLSPVLEIGSLIILFATLAVLSVQIRSQNRAARSQAYVELLGQSMKLTQFEIQNEAIFELFERETETLNKEELKKERWLFNLEINLNECAYLQWKEGIMTRATFNGWKESMNELVKYPGFKRHWSDYKWVVNRAFAKFIEKIMSEQAQHSQPAANS
jgi:hypothetical protein